MKTCPKCNKDLKDTAKFCGGCGYKFPDGGSLQTPTTGASCPKCGHSLKPGAKFCGKCGAKLEPKVAQAEVTEGLETLGNSGFVKWTMLPGQVAVRISEDEVNACGKIKGFVIQDGTKALVFVNGKIVAELPAGSYALSEFTTVSNETTSSVQGGILGLLRRAGNALANAAQSVVRLITNEKPSLSIVLIRSTEFPLVFTLKDATTAGIHSDVGLHLLCKVTNINAFYQTLLLDQKFVSFESFQRSFEWVVKNQINLAVASLTPNQIENNPQFIISLQAQLQAAISEIYPFITISKVLQVTTENQALANLNRMGEELYISEQELSHLQKRNDFLNRLQATKNAQELAELRAANGQEVNRGQLDAEFQAKKLEIYKQMALTKNEQDKFDLMLAAEKKLREAKTQEQIDVAMHEYEQSGMLREQEIAQLLHKGQMADLRNTQEYDMAELKGELAMRREQDAYSDERRDKDATFQDARRRAEIQLDREEQLNQLEMLRQAQAIRMEREDAAHRRMMESENAARAHAQAMQQAQLDAKLENQRIYAGMTFEQIMAANPDISPEAAKALAQKFNSDSKDELLKAREADMARQSAQQMEMMRMMQQMAMAGMGAKQAFQDEMIAAKQAELNRTRDDANHHENRLLSGIQSAVTAAGVAFAGRPIAPMQSSGHGEPTHPETPIAKTMPSSTLKCPACGAELEPDSSFCGECGNAL